MLKDTIFLFSVNLPNGEVMEAYRQDASCIDEKNFLYITINRFRDRTPMIFLYRDYGEMMEFIDGELEFRTVLERAVEEAEL